MSEHITSNDVRILAAIIFRESKNMVFSSTHMRALHSVEAARQALWEIQNVLDNEGCESG